MCTQENRVFYSLYCIFGGFLRSFSGFMEVDVLWTPYCTRKPFRTSLLSDPMCLGDALLLSACLINQYWSRVTNLRNYRTLGESERMADDIYDFRCQDCGSSRFPSFSFRRYKLPQHVRPWISSKACWAQVLTFSPYYLLERVGMAMMMLHKKEKIPHKMLQL